METIFIEHFPVARLGEIWIGVSDRGLAVVDFNVDFPGFVKIVEQRFKHKGQVNCMENHQATAEVKRQILEYLNGNLKIFGFSIDWTGLPPFQEQVLRLTYTIPYGSQTTYAEIARQLGKPHAARAVGQAEARNPLPLVVPCHRVVGSDGLLHGYGGPGGLATKEWLLQLEK